MFVNWTHKTQNVPDAIYQSLKVIQCVQLPFKNNWEKWCIPNESGDSFLQFSNSAPTAGSFHVSSNLKKNNPKVKSADIKVRAMLLRLCACSVQVHNIKPSIRLSLNSKKKPLWWQVATTKKILTVQTDNFEALQGKLVAIQELSSGEWKL